MKVAIQQPYFFPYLNYFCLLQLVDVFIVFDQVQYSRHSWFERNRILKPNEDGSQWIHVPLHKHSHTEQLNNIRINNNLEWQRRILAQLELYKKKAPYYSQIKDLLSTLFEPKYDRLVDLNTQALKAVCDYLGISVEIRCLTEMNLEFAPANAPDEWALNICKALGGPVSYYNLPGGVHFFDREKYMNNGIDLHFPQLLPLTYPQRRSTFEPNLSVLDVMMFNAPAKIQEQLQSFQLL